jgi:hypothetical protein
MPATAELLGADICGRHSWSAIAAGECQVGIPTATGAVISSRTDSPDSTQLVTAVDGIPEPETYALMLVGLVALAVVTRWRRR